MLFPTDLPLRPTAEEADTINAELEKLPIMVACVCGKQLPVQACRSAAGWYVGLWCPECGPYDRLSYWYYKTEAEVQAIIDDDAYGYSY